MKKLWLLFFLLSGDIVRFSFIHCQNQIELVNENNTPILELEDDVMPSDDEEMLVILDQKPRDPSMVWTLICTIGSAFLANCIHAKKYASRVMGRIKTSLKRRRSRC